MNTLFFATDRQAEHLEQAQEMLGTGRFLSDAFAVAAYSDAGSKRELVCIAVFEAIREDDAALQIALTEGADLSAEIVDVLCAIAFDPARLSVQIIHAHVGTGDAGVLAGLIRAGFQIAGHTRSSLPGQGSRAILSINRRQADRRLADAA